jgi:hypothetical protein
MPQPVDSDVAQAAAAAASTLETAAKGIVYEHRAASGPAQRLADDMKRGLEELARSEGPVADRDSAAALRAMEKLALGAAAALGDGERSYLLMIDRVMKPTAKDEPEPQSRLIVP